MTRFQIIVLGIFAFFIAAGLIFFSVSKGKQATQAVDLTFWGVMPQGLVQGYINAVTEDVKDQFRVQYVEKRPDTIYAQYVEALASGQGPDALLLSHEDIFKFRGKLTPIPYDSFPAVDYKSAFIQEGELYLGESGIQAIPFAVDPLVMYWNRNLFTNALVAQPPQYWDEFNSLVPRFTQKDGATNILRSAIGMGEFANVNNAKQILSLLMMQAGTPVTSLTSEGVQSNLLYSPSNNEAPPASSAISFYTQFADPIKQIYTWNRSLLNSQAMFAGNRLAMYIGFASELRTIQELNPNLNFDVVTVPQPRGQVNANQVRMTYGKIYGFSIARSSRAVNETLGAIFYLTDKSRLPYFTQYTGLPSVRRDALAIDTRQGVSSVFAVSSLMARGWIDPDAARTTTIFKNIIDGVTSGRVGIGEALTTADAQMRDLLGY